MQMNSLHSSCCLLRRFIWSRRHFKDFITVMVSQRNPTSQFLPRDGETCRSQKPARFYWITARVCLIKHEEHNDRTVCGWVFFFSYSPGSLCHCCSAEKLHDRKETSWLDSWVRLSPTYPNHSPIRLKWLNYNYLWSRTFPLSCFFSPCIIKQILDPFIGSSNMWPT